MLAEQAEGLAKAKGQAQATADFAKKNIAQLITLRGALQKNIEEVGSTLKDTEWARINTLTSSRPAIVQLQNVVEIKKQNVGKIMEQILHVHIQKFTTVFDPKNFRYGLLRDGLGLLDITSQSNYEMRVYDLLNALKDPQALPIEAAQNYAQAAIRLVGGSITTEGLTQADIDDFRTMVHDDQSNLLGVIKEYEEAKSDLAMRETEYKLTQLEQEKDYAGQRAEYKLTQLEQEKDYAEQMKEINEKIAMLERERQMTMAEVQASEAAYHTVARSITEGLTIVAPHTGTVSTIYKKNGDFVEPGMPVASIDTGDTTQRFVRFHIPSNLSIPEPGTILTIMRPGYPQDEKKVILIGTGTALNGNGAYVADAKFMDPVDWPVRISVRVMPQHGLITSTLIPFDAVWWDEHAQANVWLVTEEEKIRPQQIKTGRTLGDKIEVSEGLQQGNRYVAKITEGLVQGMTLKGAQIKDNQEPEKQNDEYDDGHDH